MININFETSDAALKRLYDCAVKKGLGNIRDFEGKRCMVEGGVYNGLWIETQPMAGEMFVPYEQEAALNNNLMFIDNIRGDGRFPSVISNRNNEVKFHFMQFQGYCFPYHALNLYYYLGLDREYLVRLYDALARYDAYLWRTRDSDGDGCLETWCVFDTGEDNSSRFFDAPHQWPGDEAPVGISRLPYESLDIMCYSYEGRNTLADIAAILGNGLEKAWREKAMEVKLKIRSYLWREEKASCFDRDGNNEFMDVLYHNNIRAMYHGAFTNDMAHSFVKRHLLNPNEFWTPMPLPSIAANDPLYVSDKFNNWSGQPQGLTYQRAIRALENYGFYDIVTKLGKKFTSALLKSEKDGDFSFTQQYDTLEEIPAAYAPVNDYGPAIIAFLSYNARMYGITVIRDRIVWGALGGIETCFTHNWQGREYRIECDGKNAKATIDGREVFTAASGTRVETDIYGSCPVYYSI